VLRRDINQRLEIERRATATGLLHFLTNRKDRLIRYGSLRTVAVGHLVNPRVQPKGADFRVFGVFLGD
jgi:hypothetical protein